jgi:hypothetical protein
MHVARNRRTYVAKSGEERVYESVLLRRTYRDGGKVKHETLANLGMFPPQVVDTLEAALKDAQLVPAGEADHDHPVVAARACRRGCDGRQAGPALAAGPSLGGNATSRWR